MKESLIQVLMAGIGTLGFSIYFRVNEKNVIASTLGGVLGWAIYLLFYYFTSNLFFSNFIAALLICLYSELMARILKAPSNIFLIPGIIPLLPGGTLYYTMSGIVNSDFRMFKSNGLMTFIITFGISAGIVVGTVSLIYLLKLKIKLNNE